MQLESQAYDAAIAAAADQHRPDRPGGDAASASTDDGYFVDGANPPNMLDTLGNSPFNLHLGPATSVRIMKSARVRHTALAVGSFLGFLLPAWSLTAAPVEWTAGGGGNGHFYERVEAASLTFAQAQAAAEARSHLGLPGRLAVFETDQYAAEFEFVRSSVYAPGVADNRLYWVGASRSHGGGDPRSDWTWIDGQPVPSSVSSTWVLDFNEGDVPSGIGYYHPAAPLGDYGANSTAIVSGYIVEYSPAVPEPAAGLLSVLALGVLVGRRR